ncbi:MAG: Arc family DNA-binding protein [Rhodobacteraceae bacterium]|nr:Arc family DNA-binding protein [Paracoccaceae bacterium]MCZ8082747.1 Arc family DNA-binding protein [Paracoccaceae bacterium]
MEKPQIQPQDKYIVRMPDGLRDRIKAAADRNGRSMNAEIVSTLQDAYPAPIPDFPLSFLDWMADALQMLLESAPYETFRHEMIKANAIIRAAGMDDKGFFTFEEDGRTKLYLGSRADAEARMTVNERQAVEVKASFERFRRSQV